MRVLVVDNEADSLDFIVRALEPAAFEIKSFSSPQSALRYAVNHAIDVALLDYLMPGMNGLDLAKFIRNMQPTCTIVIVSQYAGTSDLERGFEAQIDDFITRPCSAAAFLKRVNETLLRSRKKFQPANSTLLEPAKALQFLGFNATKRTIQWYGETLKLTPFEVRLLACLTSEARYFTYADLHLKLYGEEQPVALASRTLRTPLVRLRRKLEASGHPRVIESTRRLGFRWNFEKMATIISPSIEIVN